MATERLLHSTHMSSCDRLGYHPSLDARLRIFPPPSPYPSEVIQSLCCSKWWQGWMLMLSTSMVSARCLPTSLLCGGKGGGFRR
eukprot:6119259-Amphidinium_carterae.1